MHIYYYNRDNASRSTILNVFNQTPLLFKGRKKLEWKKYSIERCEKYKTYNKQVKSYIHIQHFHRERRLTSPVFGFIFSLIFFLDTFLWNFHLVSLKSFSQRDTLKGTLMFANYSLIFTININSSLDLLKNLFYFEISYVINAKKVFITIIIICKCIDVKAKKVSSWKIKTEKFSFMNFIN